MTLQDTFSLPRADADEEAVLGIVLTYPSYTPEFARLLSPDDFYVPANQAVARAIHDLNDSREAVDPVLVWNRIQANGDGRALNDGLLFMHGLVSGAPAAVTLPHHAAAVKDAAARRRVVALSTLGHSLSSNPASGTVSSIVETLRSELDTISGDVNSGQVPLLATELDDVLSEIERVGTEGAVVGIPTGFPDLDAKLHGLRPGQMIVLAGRPAMGKALALSTPVPTPAGWSTMGELQRGDLVFGPDGLPTRVVAVSDILHGRDCFTVTFSDGESIVADAEHLWDTERIECDNGEVRAPWVRGTFTTREIRAHLNECLEYVAIANPIETTSSLLPVSPARLGRYFAILLDLGVDAATEAVPEAPAVVDPESLSIPNMYLRAPVGDRVELLLGLTNGVFFDPVGRLGAVSFRAGDARLALSIHELLSSLGSAPTIEHDAGSGQFEVSLPNPSDTFRQDHVIEGVTHRRIVSIEPVASVAVRCIQVDNADSLYLVSRGMVPTHNSTLMLDFIRTATFQYGKSALLFSLEMSQQEVVTRMLSAQGRVEMDALQTGSLSDEDWQRVARLYPTIQGTTIGIDDSPGLTVADIRAKSRAFQEQHGLDLIAVDYLQLLSPVKRTESRQQEVSEMSRNLKLLAKELGVPVIALSQLNRGSEQRGDKRPMLSDLRESGAIEQDSDVVILLHRDEVYNPETRVGEADLIIAKQRSGPTGIVPVVSQLHYSRFMPAARSFGQLPGSEGPGL